VQLLTEWQEGRKVSESCGSGKDRHEPEVMLLNLKEANIGINVKQTNSSSGTTDADAAGCLLRQVGV
jgi:hypothetical protein